MGETNQSARHTGGRPTRRRAALVFASLLAALALLPFPAVQAHHRWENHHWSSTGKPRLVVIDSLGGGFRKLAVLDPALDDWALRGTVSLEHVIGDNDSALRSSCPLEPGYIRICNEDYRADWLGHTTLANDGEHIVAATVRVNDRFGTGAKFRRFVVCHELGHSLGLWHRNKGDSCLNGGQRPDAHDLDTLAEIYGHTDEVTKPPAACFRNLVCGPLVGAPAAPGSRPAS
ncbi:MAG: hypothetical protein H0V97_10145 [Actinobacteria bacterium]|nr:hypothetical protein [Actinomycetota bacterium]